MKQKEIHWFGIADVGIYYVRMKAKTDPASNPEFGRTSCSTSLINANNDSKRNVLLVITKASREDTCSRNFTPPATKGKAGKNAQFAA
jgi:hypothetical protein